MKAAREAGGIWLPDVSLSCGGHRNLLKRDYTESQIVVQGHHPGVPTVSGYIVCDLEGCWEKGLQDLSKLFCKSTTTLR